MLTLIYPYRNRDVNRLKHSLESLKKQSISEFEVYLIDYGSEFEKAQTAENLCKDYDFVSYRYFPTQFQPWNKSKALNNIIKELKIGFCFVADVDIIFHPQFIEKALKLQAKNKTVYFQVGFLGPVETLKVNDFFSSKTYRLSNSEATGLSMFSVNVLKELRGFDEFYHFWGAEDTDIHVRIKNAGYEVEFYDDEVLMLHQWHPSYRSTEKRSLTKDLQISGIVQLNQQHLKYAIQNKTVKVNLKNWGNCISDIDLKELGKAPINQNINNEKQKIDHFLYVLLPEETNKIVKFIIHKDPYQNSSKYWIKKLFNKKVPVYFTLKQINDMVLMHIISFYRDKPYTIKVSDDLMKIEIALKV